MRPLLIVLLLALPVLAPPGAGARVLEVGDGRMFAAPSDAARVAQDGDEVHIAAGEYFDCAFWRASHLTISGAGPGTVLTDKACAGKALMVIDGHDIAVRDLTLTRVRVPDGDGAGIRAEGGSLTVERVRFIDNQSGLIAAGLLGSTLIIRDSLFDNNGACAGRACVGSLAVGDAARLEITGTRILNTHGGHALVSGATDTFLSGDTISDAETGTSSYLVACSAAGNFELRDSVLQKGPNTTNAAAAVHLVGPFGGHGRMILRGNRFTDLSGRNAAFVRNWTSSDADMQDNTLVGTSIMQTSAGRNEHRLYSLALDTKAALRHLAGMGYHRVADIYHAMQSATSQH